MRDERHRRGGWAVLTVLLLTLVLALASITPSHADERPLEFSLDGVHWTSAPSAALFGEGVVLVPGGSATATLHLRSIVSSPGMLDVSLTNVQISTADAGRAFGLAVLTEAGAEVEGVGVGLPRTRFADLANSTPLGPPVRLDPGQSARYVLTIDLESLPHEADAQATAISLDVAIAFRDATVTGGAGSTPGPISPPMVLPVLGPDAVQEPRPEQLATSEALGSDSAGALAVTGFARTVVLLAATGMIGGGLLLLLAARRRERR